MKLFCQCLNVAVHLISQPEPIDDSKFPDAQWLKQEGQAVEYESLRKGTVGTVGLGVTTELEIATSYRRVQGWELTRCMNCEMDVLATNLLNPLQVVLSALVVEDISQVTSKDLFSPVYRVLLPETQQQPQDSQSDTTAPSGQQNAFSPAPTPAPPAVEVSREDSHGILAALQFRSKELLRREEMSMKNRIAEYVRQEEAKLKALQDRAHSEAAVLWRHIAPKVVESDRRDSATSGGDLYHTGSSVASGDFPARRVSGRASSNSSAGCVIGSLSTTGTIPPPTVIAPPSATAAALEAVKGAGAKLESSASVPAQKTGQKITDNSEAKETTQSSDNTPASTTDTTTTDNNTNGDNHGASTKISSGQKRRSSRARRQDDESELSRSVFAFDEADELMAQGREHIGSSDESGYDEDDALTSESDDDSDADIDVSAVEAAGPTGTLMPTSQAVTMRPSSHRTLFAEEEANERSAKAAMQFGTSLPISIPSPHITEAVWRERRGQGTGRKSSAEEFVPENGEDAGARLSKSISAGTAMAPHLMSYSLQEPSFAKPMPAKSVI